MKYLKSIFEQTLLISFGITIAISIEGLVEYLKYKELWFSWYTPGSAIIGGLICAIPSTLLLMNLFEKEKNKAIIRIIIHCIVLYFVNACVGWFFKWFTSLRGFVMVSISYFAVYIFAWVGSFIINKQEDNEINRALKDIQDKE